MRIRLIPLIIAASGKVFGEKSKKSKLKSIINPNPIKSKNASNNGEDLQESTICCNFANGMLRTLRTYLFTALMLAATAAAAADKTPFYIIDGQLGMRYEDMPPQEEILYVTVMDSAEAVFVYGERAAGGAVVVQTKEYARRQNYQPPIRQTDADNEQYDGRPIQLRQPSARAPAGAREDQEGEAGEAEGEPGRTHPATQ